MTYCSSVLKDYSNNWEETPKRSPKKMVVQLPSQTLQHCPAPLPSGLDCCHNGLADVILALP